MHRSLVEHSKTEPFLLHILAMDEECYRQLWRLRLPCVQIVRMEAFEHACQMAEVRASRTWQEYCWTVASVFTAYVAQTNSGYMRTLENEVTYLDADLFFFSDPEQVFEEIGDRKIAIVPHRLIPSKKHLEVNGIYNVSWVTFKGALGHAALTMWATQCREWCYNRQEDGKFGDQKYLDNWPSLYGEQCHVIENIGVGLAPWNLANYEIADGPTADGKKAVMFHAHEFAELSDGGYRLTNYHLRPEDITYIYEPYLKAYKQAKESIEAVHLQG